MSEIIHRYEPLWGEWYIDEFLGCGTYGMVWKVYRKTKNGIEYAAVKEVIIPNVGNVDIAAFSEGISKDGIEYYAQGLYDEAIQEINLMKLISGCKNIVDYKDCEIKSLKEFGDLGWVIFIRLELLECFETKAAKGLTVSEILKFGIDICKALEICETHQIIHRDMKHANLFYDPKTDTYKLGDFGISRFITEPTELKGIPGMLTHMPPEVYQNRMYTCGSDQYALGIIIYRFLNQNRVPLLPPYPLPYSMKDRDAALAKRLNGCEIGAPNISIFENKEFSEEDLMLFSECGAKLNLQSLPAAIAIGKIAQKEISPDPQKRFASATDFRCALERVKEDFDIDV